MVEPPFGWRILRRLLSRDYREEWSAELWQLHRDRQRVRRTSALRFWWLLLVDVVLTAVQLRVAPIASAATHMGKVHAMDVFRHSVLVSARGLARAPGFSVAVVLTLGLGLGANATLFTVIDRLLLSPPPGIQDPEAVRRIFVHGPSPFNGEIDYNGALAYPDYRQLVQARAFNAIAAVGSRTLTIGQRPATERILAEFATSSYFPLLGVRPALGRFYGAQEDVIAGAAPTVVLSHSFWQRRFAGERTVLGKQLAIGKGVYTVIGVAPRDFNGVDVSPVDVWLPLHAAGAIESGTDWENAHGWYWFQAIVRLAPNSSEAVALEQATSAYRHGRSNNADAQKANVVGAPLLAALGPHPSREARVAQALGAIAALVLLIACANVGNLFLARGTQRRRMFAVQSALGIGRSRLILQLLTETALLSIAAGVFAFAFADAIGPALFRTLLPETAAPATNGARVLLFTTLLSSITILLAGMPAALRSSRVDPAEVLRSARSSLRTSRLRRLLLAAQSGFSIILLVSAGLFLRSLRAAQQLDLGVDLDPIVLEIELDDGTQFGEELAQVAYPLVERLRAHPAIASATVTNLAPFSGFWGLKVQLPAPDSIASGHSPAFYAGDQDYFRTVGLELRAGRLLSAEDNRSAAAPVAVVNHQMARNLWRGDHAALGKCLLIGPQARKAPCTTVVGVVEDMLPDVTATELRAAYFLPTKHAGIGFDAGQVVLIKLRAGAESQLASIRSLAQTAVPGIRFIEMSSLRERISPQLRSWQMGAILLTVFGLLALVVAAAGMYSVLTFDVTQKRFELGVRAALGAPARSLARALVFDMVPAIGLGVALGAAATVALARAATDLLFRVDPVDPLVYSTALLVLMLVAVAAAFIPARRAMRSDPRVALTAE